MGCAMLALLAACASPEGRGVLSGLRMPTLAAGQPSSEEMLAYLGRLRGMSEHALATEAARMRQVMGREPDDLTRVKTALAVALAAPGEDAELAALADPVARRDGGDADVRSMASFLQAIAAERRRQRESAAAAATRLRDERRALEAQKQRADALQERAAQLQQKLDAFTEIEKSLSDRQVPR
jgi:hypothetical protein